MKRFLLIALLSHLFLLSQAQNVGIGTTTPDHPLTVAADVNFKGIVQKNGSVEIGFWTSPVAAFLQTWSPHDLNFATNNGITRLTLSNSTGYFGIGGITPTANLDINGTFRLRGNGAALGKVLTSDAIGNATWQTFSGTGWGLTGNGGTNPNTNFLGTTDNQPLMLRHNNVYAGELNFAQRNYFIGHLAGVNTTGKNNVALGDSALKDNTTGSVNIAIGSGALKMNTINSFIVAIGDSALYQNGSAIYDPTSNGVRNTAVGSKALFANSGGHGNTALGFESGYNMGLGKNNVAIGYRAMSKGNSSEQYECIAIGIFALDSNIDQHNTAIGSYALRNNKQGFNNTGVGHSAIYGNKRGEYNTGLGYHSLYTNTDGNRNTGVGYGALNTNTLGDNNSALGTDADVSSGNLSYATAIGAGALAGQSNSIVLGAINGINGATASTNVGIGTTTPSHSLDIRSTSAFNGPVQLRLHENTTSYSRMKFTNTATANFWDVAALPAVNSANAFFNIYFFGSGLDVLSLNGNGNATLAGTLTQNSDARLKKNISPMTSTLHRLMQLNSYHYQWIDPVRDQSQQIGVLAQEVEKMFPELVKKDVKGTLSVNYMGLVPVLITAVKEQQQTIDKLEQRLQALEQKMEQ